MYNMSKMYFIILAELKTGIILDKTTVSLEMLFFAIKIYTKHLTVGIYFLYKIICGNELQYSVEVTDVSMSKFFHVGANQ